MSAERSRLGQPDALPIVLAHCDDLHDLSTSDPDGALPETQPRPQEFRACGGAGHGLLAGHFEIEEGMAALQDGGNFLMAHVRGRHPVALSKRFELLETEVDVLGIDVRFE